MTLIPYRAGNPENEIVVRPPGCTVNVGEIFLSHSSYERYFGFREGFVELHRIIATGPLSNALPGRRLLVKREYQKLLPPFPEADYEALKDSVEKRELYQPIDVDAHGTVLEGHHRLRACQELGIEPNVNVRSFDDPLKEKLFVIETNIVRRQLNRFQKIELSQPMLEIETKLARTRETSGKALSSNELRGQARDRVARRIGLSPTTYQRGLTLVREAPEELKQKLRKGSATIGGAYLTVKLNKERESIRPVDRGSPQVRIYNKDFRKGVFLEDSIDLVLTDPPYTDLEAWDDLGKLCQKVLKPKGCLVAYAGKYLARQVMNTLSKHFVVEPWPICIPFKGPSRLTYPHRGHIVDKWQMLLFYQKSREPPPYRFPDLLEPTGPEKQLHDYQKSRPEASRLLELFSMEGMTVLDPFAGAGTIIEACAQRKRNCIAFEKDPETFRILQERFPWGTGDD